ncbi:MAG: competence protein ComFB [Firmicutes bacterium]|nr:competence protein ComFB [Bacillota bacterium]
MMIKNHMENLVDSILCEVINSYDICKCNDCLNDIKSISLNNLPSMYFLSNASQAEKTAFLLDRQRRISVLAKVVESIELVRKNSHNNVR